MERIPITVDKDGCVYFLVSKYYMEKAKIAKYLMGGVESLSRSNLDSI